MLIKRFQLMVSAVAALLMLAPAFSPAENNVSSREEAQKLIGILKSQAPIFEKAKACQRLAVIGSREAVPVLAELLGDEQLAHYARFALEPIPDPSVDEALRGAMENLHGKLLVGAINSIGQRRDAKAAEALAKRLGGQDPEAAAAAAAALGRIGTAEGAKSLQDALASARGPLRPAVAEACLACAEGRLSAGQRDQAAALYDAVRQADLPEHIKAAAARGAIIARQAAGAPLLAEGLQASDPVSFAVVLGVAREVPGSEATRALVDSLGKLPPERRALVIGALGDRGDAAALPAIVEAAKGGAAETRGAAIRALGRLGDASAVPVLLEAAVQTEGEAAEAARETLEEIGGKEVDQAIAGLLERGEGRQRAILIEIAGRRRIASAVPALLKAAGEDAEPVRLAAIRALGMAAGLEDLAVLISRLVRPKTPEELPAVQGALQAAAKRLADKDGLAGKLLEPLPSASAEAKGRLLVALRSVGGPKALKAVAASARDPDEGIRGAAVRVLGEWTSEEAAPELLGLVKATEGAGERLRLLRGFSQIVSRLRFPKEARLNLCKQAMELARNDEERKVVIETLAAIPAVETFPLLIPLLASPALKEEAGAAAAGIGERILRYQPEAVREAMKQVLQATERKDLAERAKKLLQQAGEKP